MSEKLVKIPESGYFSIKQRLALSQLRGDLERIQNFVDICEINRASENLEYYKYVYNDLSSKLVNSLKKFIKESEKACK